MQPVYEVEIKFRLRDRAATERRLVALGARMREPIVQSDTYFSHPCRDFAQTDEALRLRRDGDQVAITWKGPRLDAATKTRREIELPLAVCGASAANLEPSLERWTGLLEALGFRPAGTVAKTRTPGSVSWQGRDVEVALDTVAGLGDFLEIEIVAAAGDLAAATACLESLAETLGCGPRERRSYLELVLAALGA
jgi:adenylate cyclase class 2